MYDKNLWYAMKTDRANFMIPDIRTTREQVKEIPMNDCAIDYPPS